MDIFIRNIAVSSTKDQLTDFFRPILRKIAVVSFNCQKIKGKGWAILTIGDTAKAMVFLDQYGLPADPLPNARPKNTLFFTRRPMTITPGRNSPSEYHIRALELEEKKILEKQKQTAAVPRPKKKRHANTFDFLSLSCGSWAYDRSVLTFNPYLRDALSPGPDVEARDFEIKELVRLIEENASQFFREGSIYDLARRHEHLALIHKVTVTPCALLLGGPEPEVTNRVLRQYSTHTDYFIRVTFADEDGELIRFDGRASQHKIFHERFKSVLDNGVNIAGRRFTFLGFSHSSLRSQTCWFMAPIMRTGVDLVMAERVIKQLGDFTSIRSPAKCAARIGQAFSDTTGSVPIQPEALVRIPDIERNGRTFSDGCGRGLKPTTLQIRFAGAKGVISLDTTLSGNMLCLRPSMTKFNAAYLDIEICGGAMRPLPLYLNRGFIKILEDLGVEPEVFLDLQAAMVEKLRMITLTPPNAATFLEWCRVGSAAKTPQLIRLLDDIGLPFQQDSFLKDTVEIAALSQLREIKHRSRILVENGMTLFGIMDETNTLNEGEIYAVSEKVDSNGQWQRFVLTGGEVAITRSPALHPGDIQIVQAVDVPSDSPLAKLRNCVVFSQKGDRDLPSQLSGGDLDGDLYNIIFDPLLMPKKTHHPADYPRQDPIDIGRPVEREDMTEFFIQFMETDQLGRISMMHLQMADREGEGTLHPTCIKLAGMASTAVDFSKTGIPVDMNGFPKQDYLRPDFMATGPRVIVEKRGAVFNDDDDGEEEDEKDPVSAMDPDGKSYRYYESNKVLGRLYRAIDEKAFFEQMQKDSKCLASRDPTRRSLMDKLWDYVRREAALVQWREYAGLAKESREAYESNLLETMDQYSIHHAHPLRELEVFSGSILGKSIGAQNRRIREMTAEMKDRFERDVTFIVDRITQGDDGDKDEALARSIACLANAMLEPGHGKRMHLQSWKYIAAAICLRELERFQGGLLRRI
ncbi:RdRP-domain-containing protein [Glonium stellatum]|uniref:RNA-dependent RNA polymerase n=1 Tax=Glonium stellatum TaxID=574774 RepID=A0A8E2JLW4_9PEZI|nr:RdRP-domain-containing protein [Glonium stellatum]